MSIIDTYLDDIMAFCNFFCQPNSFKRQGLLFLAETVPTNLSFQYAKPFVSIGQSIVKMIRNCTSTIDIMCQSCEARYDEKINKDLYEELISAASKGVRIRYILGASSTNVNDGQFANFAKFGDKFKLAYFDSKTMGTIPTALPFSNILILDNQSFYIGSASCDWRNYAENVDLGVIGIKTENAARELSRIYQIFWRIAYVKDEFVEGKEKALETKFSTKYPLLVSENLVSLCFTISPYSFGEFGQTSCLKAILKIVKSQKGGHLKIAASSLSNFQHPKIGVYQFWGELDFYIRKATMERNASVDILVDKSELNNPEIYQTLSGLNNYNKIKIRTISLPENKHKLLFQPKLVIGTNAAWIGTNNLAADNLLSCAGAGCIIVGDCLPSKALIIRLRDFFDRYLNSIYAEKI